MHEFESVDPLWPLVAVSIESVIDFRGACEMDAGGASARASSMSP